MSAPRIAAALVAAALLVPGAEAANPQPAQPIVVKVEGGGFHWEEAGLGVAAGVAATLLVLALLFTVRQPGQPGAGGLSGPKGDEHELS